MKEIDAATQTAAENPEDHTARRVLSDMLRAQEEYELADAVESRTTGKSLIERVNELSKSTGLPVSAKLLWAAYALIPRLSLRPLASEPIAIPPAEPPVGTPYVPRGNRSAPWRSNPDARWSVEVVANHSSTMEQIRRASGSRLDDEELEELSGK